MSHFKLNKFSPAALFTRNTYAGIAQINSGDTVGVVSSTVVVTGSPILITPFALDPASSQVSSRQLSVNSVVDNTSFAVETAGAVELPWGFSYVVLR